jgi:hypothetical protein
LAEYGPIGLRMRIVVLAFVRAPVEPDKVIFGKSVDEVNLCMELVGERVGDWKKHLT